MKRSQSSGEARSFGRAGLHLLGGEGGALVGARDEEAFEQLAEIWKLWKKYPSPRKCGLGRPGLDIPCGAMGLLFLFRTC
jgi:hypothetical protein